VREDRLAFEYVRSARGIRLPVVPQLDDDAVERAGVPGAGPAGRGGSRGAPSLVS